MLHDGSLVIIDFQDARMGPDTYDLASLLRDSYVDLAAPQVDELIAYFLALQHGASGVTREDAAEFGRRFDLMALQRNLKALGTFGYQTVVRGNTRVHPIHPAHAQPRPQATSRNIRVSSACAKSLRVWWKSFNRNSHRASETPRHSEKRMTLLAPEPPGRLRPRQADC